MEGKQERCISMCGYMAYTAGCHSPTVFHVLWFVHSYGQFDLQILVRASLGHSHLMKFWLLGAIRSWVEDNLARPRKKKERKWKLHSESLQSNRTAVAVPNLSERKSAFLPTLVQQEIKAPCHKPRSMAQQSYQRNANTFLSHLSHGQSLKPPGKVEWRSEKCCCRFYI